MSDFRKLRVWQKAHELTLKIYRETESFPKHEMYGLVSQMRRCCVSIGSNIAEGCGRIGEPDKARFLRIASGSLNELEYQLIVSRDLDYLKPEAFLWMSKTVREIGNMLGALTRTISAGKAKGQAAGSR